MAVQDEKLTVEQLAKKLKSKYPQYMMMDDSALVSKVIEKYPQYQNVLKKKDQSDQGLDGEDGTSDGGDGGLDSSKIEDNTPSYSINEIPTSKSVLLNQLNDETFIASIADGETNVVVSNDSKLESDLLQRVETYKANKEQEEEEDSEETQDVDIDAENKIDSLNPNKRVEKESLVPITKKNPNLNINPTLSNNLVNPVVNSAMEELGLVWKDHSKLNIESAYRDAELNKRVGGHEHSYHLHGMAIDLTGETAKDFMRWATQTPEGREWANKWTEGATGGPGIILEDEGGKKEHVHIQFRKDLASKNTLTTVNPHLNASIKPSQVDRKEIVGQEGTGFDMTDFLHKTGEQPKIKLSDVSHLLTSDEKNALNLMIKGSKDWKGNPFKYLFMDKESRESGEWWKTRLGDAVIMNPESQNSMYGDYQSAMGKINSEINKYLNSGYEYLGDGKYKHTKTGIVISPEMVGGNNPLLANTSALPKLINRIEQNPKFLMDEDGDGIADGLGGLTINELYNEFNGDMSNFLKQEIESLEGDDRKLKETEYDIKAAQFSVNLFDNLSKSMDESINISDSRKKINQLGEQITLAEQWLKEQYDIINEYPTYAHGGLDTRNMNQDDLNKYNKLVNDFNQFREGKYQQLLNEREKFIAEDSNVNLLNRMINGYNTSISYLMSSTDEPIYSKRADKVRKRRNKAQKSYNESTWIGKTLRSVATPIVQTTGKFIASIASVPQQAKSIFVYENEFDLTDKIAKVAQESIVDAMQQSGSSWLYRPTSLTNAESMGNVFSTKVLSDIIIFDKNKEIKNIVTKDNMLIDPKSDRYQNIVKEYTENKNSYPIKKTKEWGSFFYNFAQATTDFILDMTIAKKVGAGTRRVTGSARAGKLGFAGGLYGATNVRMYNMYYQEGLRQDMLPGEASDFANQAAMVSSVIEIVTPDFGMVNPRVKRMATDKAIDAISGRITKDAVSREQKRNIINSVFNRNAAKYGLIEGFEEVAQGGAVDLVKDQWWNSYNFDTKFDVNEALEEFTIGALIGYGSTSISDASSLTNKEYIKSGMYKDGVYHAYTNQEETFRAIDNQVGKQFMVNGDFKTFTETDAKKMKDGLKNRFKTMENLIGKRDLNDLSKRELLNLIEYKQNAESLQGSKNQDILEEVNRRITESDTAIDRILKNEDPIKVMADLANSMDFEVREYIGSFMDITKIGVGTKALIRRIAKGDPLTETQQRNSLIAIKARINALDRSESLTSEERAQLALLKKLEKDVTNIKTTKDEETITRGRGETGRTTRGAAGTSLRESIEQTQDEKDTTTLNQNIGKRVAYKGKEGILTKNKKGEFVLKTSDRGRGIKIKDATGRKRLSTVGLTYRGRKVSVTPEGKLDIDGQDTGQILGFSKNDDGSLDSIITLDNEFSDDVKNKAAARFKTLQRRRNNGEISIGEFRDAINKTRGLSMQSNNDIKFSAAAGKITNDIINTGEADVISMQDVEEMIQEATEELGFSQQQKQELNEQKETVEKKKESKKNIKQQKRVVTPLFDSTTDDNIDNLIEEYSKFDDDVYRRKVKVLQIVKKLYGALGMNVTIHNNEAALRDFFASDGIFLQYVGNATIIEEGLEGATPEVAINLDTANPNTMFHEGAHPFITSLVKMSKTNPELKKVLDGIKTDLETVEGGKYIKFAKLGYAKGKDGVELRDTDAKDKDISNPDRVFMEALAEFLGDAGLRKFDEKPTLLNKAKSYINTITNYLFKVDILSTEQEPLELTLDQLSQITNLDDITKIFTEATSRGLNFNEKRRGRAVGDMSNQYNNDPGYSTLSNSVKFSDLTNATPKQWMKDINRFGGKNISQEMRFIGMKDFLDSVERAYPDGIPKTALQDYINLHETSIQFDDNTMTIISGNETLSDINYDVLSNEIGEKVLFIKNIKAPNTRMMSNLAPTIRHLITFASTGNYDGIAFESGDAFQGPKAEFFDSVVPEVINDIMQSIDPKAGPILSEVDGQGKTTLEITNPVTSLVEDLLNPSRDTELQDGYNDDAKTIYSTDFQNQFGGQWLRGTSEFFSDFSFRREILPMGNIPKEVFDLEWRFKSNIKAEKFRLMKLTDRLRKAVEDNQKSSNPIPIKSINDALSDPTAKIRDLENEIKSYEYDLESLDKNNKSYAASVVLSKIRDAETHIKELKEAHVGRATLRDFDSAPELKRIIKQVRKKVDSLSIKLKDVVNEKLGIVLDKNMGIYINRQYRIHHDSKYKEDMIRVIDKMRKAKGDPKKLNKIIKRYGKEVDLIQNAANIIRDRLTDKFKRNYNDLESGESVSEDIILNEIRKAFADEAGFDNLVSVIKRSNDINTGIFRKRQDLPDAISDLFSPIENPLFNIVSTLTKQVEELEALEFKTKAIAAMDGSLVYREDRIPEGFTTRESLKIDLKFSNAVYYAATPEIKEFLDGEIYKPTGAYKLAQIFNGAIKLSKTVYSLKTHVRNFIGNMYFSAINGHFSYSDMVESYKVMQNLFDVSTTQEREIMFTTMIENGIIDSVYAEELLDILKDGQFDVLMTDLFENNMDYDLVKKKYLTIRDTFKNPLKAPAYVIQGLKHLNTLTNKAYLWEDVIWKGAGFISEVDLYQRAGFERTEAISMAADNVRGGYTTYSLVPKAGKRLRRMLLVGDFVSFPAEVFRTGVTSLNIAGKMIRSGNPVLQMSGYKRLFGTVFAWTTLPHLYTGLAALFASGIGAFKDWTDDDDEDIAQNPLMDHKLMNGEERKIDNKFTLYDSYSDFYDKDKFVADEREFSDTEIPDVSRDKMIQLFLPSYMKYGDVKLVSAQLNDDGTFSGTYYVWNSSDNMSNNVVTRVVNAMLNTPEDDPTFRRNVMPTVMDDIMHALFEPFLGKSMMLQLTEDLLKQETQTGKKLNKNTDDLRDIVRNNLNHIQKEIRPAIVDQVVDMLESWHPEQFLDEEEMKKRKSPVHESIALMGFRFSRFNLTENLDFKVRYVANEMKKIDPDDENPEKIEAKVKRQMEYLDKLYHYSEALGIDQEGVVVLDRDGNEMVTRLENRDAILSKHIQGYRPGNPIYEYLNRNRINSPDYDSYVRKFDKDNPDKPFTFLDYLRPWQVEEVEEELDNY